jgi:hypothetical protein
LKRGLSQPRKTMIHTVGTNPEPRAGAGAAPKSLAEDLRDEQ